jgi:preprotein translocase subunit Sec63
MNQNDIDAAFQLFALVPPVNRQQVDEKFRALLATWHPHRYANLTNNPRRYMQMYKKGEAMTKDIQKAYEVLVAWLERQNR